jgi:hypothetical protein
MRGKQRWNTLATVLSSRTITAGKNKKPEETGMTSRIEPHRVSAYNTSKHSENKMHDDTVAKRYGFIGGLVPGVDVMAYMMHLPVAKWGRAFLERGLIEARFVKPVMTANWPMSPARRATACLRSRSRAGETLRDRHGIAATRLHHRFRFPTLSRLRR